MFDSTKKHVVAESSKLIATYGGAHIYNLIDKTSDIDNGKLLVRGELEPGYDQTYKALTPSEGDTDLVLVLNPPLIYEEYTSMCQAEYNFYNAAGTILRCYSLVKGDVFTVSTEGITPADVNAGPVVGNHVTADGRDIKEVTTKPNTGFVGKIIEKVVQTNGFMYRIEVLAN